MIYYGLCVPLLSTGTFIDPLQGGKYRIAVFIYAVQYDSAVVGPVIMKYELFVLIKTVFILQRQHLLCAVFFVAIIMTTRGTLQFIGFIIICRGYPFHIIRIDHHRAVRPDADRIPFFKHHILPANGSCFA